MEATSMTMSTIPNIITSSPSGGRFDFDDGGTYCGGWQDGKAHGHGVCTGPKNVGEYSGSWNFGFEMSGVYKWTNGAVYEGRWQNGKRHGVGVEYNGKWIYKGEWSQGLKGRYGVKASSNSAVKYEGTWANGLQDGYGSETYSDGGYYQGQMCRGLRHGYGVRKSAPYGDSQLNNPSKNGPLTGGPSSMLLHSNSIQSTGSSTDLNIFGSGGPGISGSGGGEDDSPKPEDGFKPNIDRTLVSKNGFVLVAKPLDVPIPQANHSTGNKLLGIDSGGGKRRNSLTKLATSTRIPNQTGSLFRNLRLRKQKSTSDLDVVGGNRSTAGGKQPPGGGLSSYASGQAADTGELPIVPFTLSPEELDITDPTTVETYTGEWKHDKRNGHGVCDRSDGLKYEGQWHNDMKCGYGVTTFKDGTKEEGKYKNNILIVDSKVKRFFQLGGSNIRQRIDEAVKMANQAQTMALKKAEIAGTRAATARDKADQAMTAAIEANRDSQIAYAVARQYSDSQQLQQFNLQQQLGFAAQQQQLQASPNNFMFNPQMDQQQHPFLGRNLNLATSPLQMRRISQNQQRNSPQQQQSQQLFNNTNQTFQQQQDRQTFSQHPYHHNHPNANNDTTIPSSSGVSPSPQQQQFLGPVEPFNGRRGSFRGGSQPPGGGGPATRLPAHHHHPMGAYGGGMHPASARQASTDPFGDFFDHYKSSSNYMGPGSGGPAAGHPRRSMLTKRTSLDYQHLRQASVPPRQLGGGQGGPGGGNNGGRMKSFRMSSLDHAEEHNQHYGNNVNSNQVGPAQFSRQARMSQELANDQQQQFETNNNNNNNNNNNLSQQQQFRHLVTSGEEMQQQSSVASPAAPSNMQHEHDDQYQGLHQQQTNNPTPTNSSYILHPHSSAADSFNASNRTSSPSNDLTLQQMQQQQQQQQQQEFYNQQQASFMQQQQRQHFSNRDNQSLADEQLYLADRRRYYQEHIGADRVGVSEYSHYDFSISSAPRPSQRCMRRTASLSRATTLQSSSTRSTGAGGAPNANLKTRSSLMDTRGLSGGYRGTTPISGSQVGLATLTTAAASAQQNKQQFQQQTQPIISISHIASVGNDPKEFGPVPASEQYNDPNFIMPNSHHYGMVGQLTANSCNSSTSATSSVSPLNRKPSLQVRYDPVELGGLMSREEVAALSHAQREQRRIEAELNEKKAKRPLLHLYLTLKDIISRHQLILSVLVVNICLMKLFADLIV